MIRNADGSMRLATRDQLEQCPAWKHSFGNLRKDHRFFEIVHDTIDQGFEYRYLILETPDGQVKAIQPFFLVHQDLLTGTPQVIRNVVETIRKAFPGFLKMRTLMVGCAGRRRPPRPL